MLKTNYRHVVIDKNGCPIVGKDRVPVAQIALEVLHHGVSTPEVQLFLHPDLKMGEIHDALTFYFDKYIEEHPTVLDRIKKLRTIATSDHLAETLTK